MATFTESINEIKNSKSTRTQKRDALIKLGLRPNEAYELMLTWTAPATPRESAFTSAFGVEIECINCQRDEMVEAATRQGLNCRFAGYTHTTTPYFKLVTDSSLSGNNPLECVTPVLKGNSGMNDLKKCCFALAEIGATVNRSCGLHVHVDARNLTAEAYCNTFVNYMYLEEAIDKFMANSRRGSNSRWAASLKPFAGLLTAQNQSDVYAVLRDRYFKVNPEAYNRHKTIEFRQHQGSTDYTKISAWVKFLIKLVGWSRKNRLTKPVTEIDDIPFINASEKSYFKTRANAFNAL